MPKTSCFKNVCRLLTWQDMLNRSEFHAAGLSLYSRRRRDGVRVSDSDRVNDTRSERGGFQTVSECLRLLSEAA